MRNTKQEEMTEKREVAAVKETDFGGISGSVRAGVKVDV